MTTGESSGYVAFTVSVKRPRPPSRAEEELALHIRAHRLPQPTREHPFGQAIGRNWRFDFAWPGIEVTLPWSDACTWRDRGEAPRTRLAVEIDGGKSGGVHRIASRFQSDCVKLNVAATLGWLVLRFTSEDISSLRAVDSIAAILAPGRAELISELSKRRSRR